MQQVSSKTRISAPLRKGYRSKRNGRIIRQWPTRGTGLCILGLISKDSFAVECTNRPKDKAPVGLPLHIPPFSKATIKSLRYPFVLIEEITSANNDTRRTGHSTHVNVRNVNSSRPTCLFWILLREDIVITEKKEETDLSWTLSHFACWSFLVWRLPSSRLDKVGKSFLQSWTLAFSQKLPWFNWR